MSGGHSRANPRGEPEAIGADLVIPLLAVGFTIYYLWTTAGMSWEARSNGLFLGSVLLVLIAAQLVRMAMRVSRGDATLRLGAIVADTPANRKRLGVVALLGAFILSLPLLGATLALFLLVLLLLLLMGVRQPFWLAVLPVGIAAVVYALFIGFLGARLPRGPIEALIGAITSFGGAA
jgi:hypothetical protein